MDNPFMRVRSPRHEQRMPDSEDFGVTLTCSICKEPCGRDRDGAFVHKSDHLRVGSRVRVIVADHEPVFDILDTTGREVG